ncbi:MAG: glycosyltransferase [Candidatus Altiarchaeota archaeon]
MKALILHDYLDNIGGGEKLMLALAREVGADFATLDYDSRVVDDMDLTGVNVINLGSTPKLPPLKQIAASMKYSLCDLRRDYDFFIFSGNWAHYAARTHHPNLWYCHTPVRAFYTDYENMALRMGWQSTLFRLWVTVHRRLDGRSVRNVDKILVNSKNTQGRVKRYYGRDCEVVYPGIDTKRFGYKESGDFWLSVNRLYPEKRVDLQADAFRMMPDERLVVVGGNLAGDHSNKYVAKLLRNKPANVEYRGRVPEDEVIDLYSRCKGFICTALDEDFGMTPVEAMASGKPVVATREGGYLETVVDGVTGVFVNANALDIKAAVREVGGDPGRYRRACEKRALLFDFKVFVECMKGHVSDI